MNSIVHVTMPGTAPLLSKQAATAHNTVDSTTTGYSADMHHFQTLPLEGIVSPTGGAVADPSIENDLKPDTLKQTGRALDIAVKGPGFIALSLPDGSEAYTRNGSLELTADGVLQTRTGIPVRGYDGALSIPPDVEITIASDGTISGIPRAGTQDAALVIGRIKLVNPAEHALVRGDDDLFRLHDGKLAEASDGASLVSGYLEGSNANTVSEMVAMIWSARQLELQQKVLSVVDQHDSAAPKILTPT